MSQNSGSGQFEIEETLGDRTLPDVGKPLEFFKRKRLKKTASSKVAYRIVQLALYRSENICYVKWAHCSH